MELLGRLGRESSLAGAGDRVDFVVSLAHAPGQSSGRLERQSRQGTVAIRDLVAGSCAEVADALALSLDLALEPDAASPSLPAPAPGSLTSSWQTRLGAQGQVTSGLGGATLPGGALFIDWEHAGSPWEARLSLLGARGQRQAAVDLSLGLLGARAEACRSASAFGFSLAPCAGTELGVVVAEGAGPGGRGDAGLWSAAVGHLRASWRFAPTLAFEAQTGLRVPFIRYRFDAVRGGEVTASSAVGWEGALGLSFLL